MDFTFKTIHEFNDYFRDEKTCYEFFEKIRWNGVPVCPHCGSEKYYTVDARGKFADIPSYRCGVRACGLPFTVRTKSIFEGSKVEFRKWLQAAFELVTCKNGISSVELGTRIGVSQKTAWFINHRLRGMLKEVETKIDSVASVDETYIGGKNKNRHESKKKLNIQGRSTKDKIVVFGARSITGQVRTKVVPDTEAATLIPIIEEWVEMGALMVSDDWTSYKSLKQNYFHVVVNHSEKVYVNGAFTTNGIENFWSLFKRGVNGTHHVISEQHCQKYANEFADRYNKKDLTNIERFEVLVNRCDTERETYNKLTSANRFKF